MRGAYATAMNTVALSPPDWLPEPFAADWPRIARASRYVREHCQRGAPMLRALADSGALHSADAPGALFARVGELPPTLGMDEVMSRLRQRRNAEMVRIALRELLQLATLDETLAALSDLADASLQTALDWAQTRLRERYGEPIGEDSGEVSRLIVLGMGKLGGRELNFSSDIDLIYLYTEPGETNGASRISNEEYFARLCQDLSRLLSTVTPDGFVFRIDTLLRPFGSVGAIALSVDAAERYYEQHGREWERYAMIKARPVAGDLAAGTQLIEALRPFVYRRYLDFGALGALRELKRLIEHDAHKRGAEANLKLGPGGIRELEFIVQLFQLTRGGHDRRLRDAQLRPVLAHLGRVGLLPAEAAQTLDACYVLLRRMENAVQLYGDEQTHVLPQDEERRAALCAALGISDWPALMQTLDTVRERVRHEYERLFVATEAVAEEGSEVDQAEPLWQADEGELVLALQAQGYRDSARVAREVLALRGARMVRTLADGALQRLQTVTARLLEHCAGLPEAEVAAERSLRLLAAIAGRGTYLTLLRDSAMARMQLARLCEASPWIATLLTQTPALLDTLLDPRLAREAPDREVLSAELAERARGVPDTDIEAVMDLLRRYRQEMTLRIAAADLAGSLPLVKVSDRLTWLAEAIVAHALSCAAAQLAASYGVVAGGRFAVIGYGKFGSIELGYGSDLDLVFVYDVDDAEALSDGARGLAAPDWFMRLAQRVVQLLSAQTSAGRAYEVDLQLRPSGNSGLAVTRLAGFARYQRSEAWTWEHQALLRARVVAGDVRLAADIAGIRAEVLSRRRDVTALRAEVVDMRRRMREVLQKRVAGRWDVKHGEGGLIDAEFITQFLCLAHAADAPALIAWSDNWRQLEALAEHGLIDAGQRDALLAAERSYRGFLHRRALQQQDALSEDDDFRPQRAAVAALWQFFLGDRT